MNKVILMGRLTRDAEMFGQKSKVARFTLAVDRTYGEDETDFFNCVSFGKQAEFVEKFLKTRQNFAPIVGQLLSVKS